MNKDKIKKAFGIQPALKATDKLQFDQIKLHLDDFFIEINPEVDVT